MPGVFGRGVASIGGATNRLMRGQTVNAGVRAAQAAVRNAPRGGGSAAIGSFYAAQRAVNAANMKTGKRVVGGALAATGFGMANRGGSGARGGYQPRRSVVPVPQNGMPM